MPKLANSQNQLAAQFEADLFAVEGRPDITVFGVDEEAAKWGITVPSTRRGLWLATAVFSEADPKMAAIIKNSIEDEKVSGHLKTHKVIAQSYEDVHNKIYLSLLIGRLATDDKAYIAIANKLKMEREEAHMKALAETTRYFPWLRTFAIIGNSTGHSIYRIHSGITTKLHHSKN